MNRKTILLYSCCILLLAGLVGEAVAYVTRSAPVVTINQQITPAPTTTPRRETPTPPDKNIPTQPTPTPTQQTQPPAQPTTAPTAKPTVAPTHKPKPTATPTTGPTYHSCSIASCPNPWGYHLQYGDGNPLVTSAPSGFCDWFACLPDFGNENGDIVECSNGTFSWNGSNSSEGCPGMTIKGWLAP